jgi:hypothetical protein
MISEPLARCIAKISGDGNLYYRYIRYSNNSETLLNEFMEDIIKEFGNMKFTKGIVNSGTKFVQIHNKEIISKFLEYLPDYKSNNVYIPSQIINSSSQIKSQYLRSLFDDEGSASIRIFKKTNEWKRDIKISSNSLKLLEQVANILQNYEIFCNKIKRNKPNSLYDKTYYLGITGKSNLLNFRNNIGFKHPIKYAKLDLIIESYGKTLKKHPNEFYKIKEKLEKGVQLSKLPIRSIVQLGT